MTEDKPIWHHPRWRVALAGAVSAVIAVSAVVLAALGRAQPATVLLWLLVVTVVLQSRPWVYAHLKRPQLVLRTATVALFVLPCLTVSTPGPRPPRVAESLLLGAVAGIVLVAAHARDSALLLNPEIVSWQPRMSVSGAAGRFLYVIVVVPLEEVFYRKLVIDSFAGSVTGIGAVAVSVAVFVYGDWCGSWGPASSRKRFWSELCLATVTAATYFATGSLAGPLVTHYLYNSPQLALPPANVIVHRRRRGAPALETP